MAKFVFGDMSAARLLCDILKSIQPAKTTIHGTDKELRFSGARNVELHVAVGKSAMFSSFVGTVTVQTADLLKLLRETKFFGDLDFDSDPGAVQLLIEEGGWVVSLECPAMRTEYLEPPVVSAQLLCSVDETLLRDLSTGTNSARPAELRFGDSYLNITLHGNTKIEAEQTGLVYLKKDTGKNLFVLPAEALSSVAALCKLSPTRIVLGVDDYLSVFYVYFKGATVIVYSPGTLI